MQQLKTRLISLKHQQAVGLINSLSQHELQQLSRLFSLELNQDQQPIFDAIRVKLTFARFLSKSDVSYRFVVFQNEQYLQQLQSKQFNVLLNQRSKIYVQFPQKYNNILKDCSDCVDEELRQQFSNQLYNFFFQPNLPMPKLLRNSISSTINSPLQNYLVDKIQNQDYIGTIYEQVFQQINEKLYQLQEKHIKNMIGNYQLATQLVYAPHLITYSNYKSKFIQGNDLHNLLLTVFGMTDLILELTEEYLKIFNDPLEIFVQFCSKYFTFQNIIIGIEQNMGCLFQNYSQLYEQVFNKNSPKLSFWKPALIMWIKRFNQYHQKNSKIFVNLANELVFKNNKIQEILENNQDLKLHQTSNSLIQLLRKQEGQIHVLFDAYQQYLVDVSINQNSVTYCGHSEQELDEIFINSQNQLIKQQTRIFNDLKNLNMTSQNISNVISQRIKNYRAIIKPRTLMNIIKVYQSFDQNIGIKNKIKSKDRIIQTYNQNLLQKRPNTIKQNTSLYKLALGLVEKQLPETVDSQQEQFDQSFEFYDSDNEQQTDQNQKLLSSVHQQHFQLENMKKLSKTN